MDPRSPALYDDHAHKGFEEYGEILGDGATVAASIDRLIIDPCPLRQERSDARTYDICMPFVLSTAQFSFATEKRLLVRRFYRSVGLSGDPGA
jgi:hypothetical protein